MNRILLFLFLLSLNTVHARDTFSVREVPAAYLLKSRTVTVGNDGSKTVSLLMRMKLLQEEGFDRFGDVEVPYNAHYLDARLVRAETTTPAGEKVAVDPEVVKDLLPRDGPGYREYSDLRNLSFSMPALSKGAIIEYEVELTGREPIIEGEFWTQHFMDDLLPVYTSRFEIVSPVDFAYSVSTPNMDEVPVITTNAQLVSRTWELREIPKLRVERNMPPALEVRKSISASSLEDWKQVEDWFKTLLADRISASDEITALSKKLIDAAAARTRIEKMNALLHFVQKDVRYVAIELGQGAYQPRPAEDCLKNLYGDCKDKSVLLISLLKAAGIDAQIALVRPNYFGQIDTSLPHPGQFNHAIVYVPGDKQAYWLDPTVPGVDVTSHPAQLDACQALVMGPSATFKVIPSLPPEMARLEREFEIFASPDGNHRVVSRETGHGRVAAALRTVFSDTPEDGLEELMREQAKRRPGYIRLINWQMDDRDKLTSSFSYEIEYVSNGILSPASGGYAIKIEPFDIARGLILRDWQSEKDGRTHPLVFHTSGSEALVLKVHLPPGYKLGRDVQPYHKNFPHGALSIAVDTNGRVFEARVQADVQRSIIKASRFDMTRRSVDRSLQSATRTVEFVNEVAVLLSQRKPAEAKALLTQLLAENPKDAQLHHTLGRFLSSLGYAHDAEQAFKKALELDPKVLGFYESYAASFAQYDGVADARFDRARVLKLFDQAADKVLESDARRLQLARAVALCTDQHGVLFGPDVDLAPAIGITETLLDKDPEDPQLLNLRATLAFQLGEYETALDYYHEALEQGSQNLEMLQGLWRAEAMTGDIEAAINRLSGVFKDNKDLIGELVTLARNLSIAGRKADVRFLAEEIAGRVQREEVVPELMAEFDLLQAEDRIDYQRFDQLDTPRNTVLTLFAAHLYHDHARFKRCLSKDVEVDCETLTDFLRRPRMNRYFLRLQESNMVMNFQAEAMEEKQLADDLVHVRLQRPPTTLRRGISGIEVLLKKEGKAWKVIDLKMDNDDPPNFLVSVLHQAIQANHAEFVAHLAEYIDEVYSGTASNARRRDYRLLIYEPCSDVEMQAKAFVASALMNSGLSMASDAALAYLTEVVEEEPENSAVLMLLADLYSARGYAAEHAAWMAKAAAVKSGMEPFLVQKALAFLQAGELEAGKQAMADLEKEFPAARSLVLLRREAAQRAGELDEAFELLERAAEDREQVELSLNELLLYLDLNKTNELFALEEQMGKEQPNAGMHRMLAYAYIALDDLDGARRQLDTARLLGLGTSDVLLELVRLLTLEGEDAAAERMLADYVKTLPCPQDGLRGAGYVYHGRGNLKAANEAYEKGMDNQGPLNQVYFRLLQGVCLFEQGKKAAARKNFKSVANNTHGSAAAKHCADFAALLLNQKEIEAVEDALEAIEDQLLRKDHLTEFYYYAGMKALFAKDQAGAKVFFQQVVDLKRPMHMEYFLARAQLVKLREGE